MEKISRITDFFPKVDNKNPRVADKSADHEASCSSASEESRNCIASTSKQSDHQVESNSEGIQSNSSKTTNFKRPYNSMKVVNKTSKQSLKNSITKSSSKKYKYSDEDELLILSTFSKIKKTKISQSTQTIPNQENSFRDTKSNVYLPD